MRKTLACYVRGFPHAARIRPALFQENDPDRLVEMLEEYGRFLGEAAAEPVAAAGAPA
jgi:hypothetical protein